MATLAVWTFGTADGASEAQASLADLFSEDVVGVRDSAIVSWTAGAAKPQTKQAVPRTGAGALGDGFWGLLFGLIFLIPLLGAAIGAPTGAMTGALADVGIDDRFINKVRDSVTPGTSALFVISSDAVTDGVHDTLAGSDRSALILTLLTAEQEAALRNVFAG
jgi:uncharacterized membrane protein